MLKIVKLGWTDQQPPNAFVIETLNELGNQRVRCWAKWQQFVGNRWIDVNVDSEQVYFRRYENSTAYDAVPFVAKTSDYLQGDCGPAAIHRESEEAARQYDREWPNSVCDKFFMGYRTAARKYKPDAMIAGHHSRVVRKIGDRIRKLKFVVEQFLVKPDKLGRKQRKKLAKEFVLELGKIEHIE